MEKKKNMNCMIVSEYMATSVTNRVIGYRIRTVPGMSNWYEVFFFIIFFYYSSAYYLSSWFLTDPVQPGLFYKHLRH